MANPVLNRNKFEQDIEYAETMSFAGGQVMTVNGTLQTTAFMGLIMIMAAAFTWTRFSFGYTDMAQMLTIGGAIGGFILALIISFMRISPKFASIRYLVPCYAALEGLFLGGISAMFEAEFPGIVSNAIAGTFAALFSMLLLYRCRFIACSNKFRSVIFISTLSIAAMYLVNIIGHLFGYSIPVVYSSSPMGILLSVVIVVIAALNLILDFDFIEQGAMRNFPKEYEWYGAFGLLVTIVWLYIEILRLLAKLQRR